MINEIALVVGTVILLLGAIELGKLRREVDVLTLAIKLHDYELDELKK